MRPEMQIHAGVCVCVCVCVCGGRGAREVISPQRRVPVKGEMRWAAASHQV